MPEELNRNNLELRSEEVQEILSNPPSWIVRWGITLVFILAAILFILSFIIKYPDFVSAEVIVTTETPAEKVMARHSGPIEKIYIKNRDTVKVNQKLAVIKNTANIEDVFFLKDLMDSIKINSENFSFPIEHTAHLGLGDIETAYVGFEKNYLDYFLLKDLEPYTNQLYGNRRSLEEIKIRLEDHINQKKLLDREYELKQINFERYKKMFQKGVVSRQDFESKELEFIQMQKNINAMAITISQMREAISSANQTLKNTIINKQEDNTKYLKNLVQSYNSLKKAIKDWEYNYVLSSSINGIISFQDFWGINQYVNTDDIVFSILPLDNSMLVGKLALPSKNAGKVNIGQKVLVKLSNFPYQQYGMLIGKVKNLSISPNIEGNYIVYISLPNGTKTSYGQDLGFEQELIGNAEIITEDLSVSERIFYKIKEIFKYN